MTWRKGTSKTKRKYMMWCWRTFKFREKSSLLVSQTAVVESAEWPWENADSGEINLSPSISPEANDPLLDTFRFGELAVGEHPDSTLRPRFSRPDRQRSKEAFALEKSQRISETFRSISSSLRMQLRQAKLLKEPSGISRPKTENLWGNWPVRERRRRRLVGVGEAHIRQQSWTFSSTERLGVPSPSKPTSSISFDCLRVLGTSICPPYRHSPRKTNYDNNNNGRRNKKKQQPFVTQGRKIIMQTQSIFMNHDDYLAWQFR